MSVSSLVRRIAGVGVAAGRHGAAALIFVAGLAMCLVPSVAEAQALVYFIRHAERADGGPAAAAASGSGGAPADPDLSAAGQARAERLAALLGEAGVAAIYTSQFKRTQQTARPLATRLGLTVRTMPSDAAAVAMGLRRAHDTDVVLVVGHSNTVPAIITALGGPAVTIGDDEYDNLFVFVPATGVLSRIRY